MRWSAFVLVLLACACAADSDRDRPLRISGDQLANYWLVAEGPTGNRLEGISPEELATGGAGTVEYLIDAKGRVHNVRVLKSVPIAYWGNFAARVVSQTRYKPAPSNTERTPVVVTHRVSFGERYHHTDAPPER